jgi:hypothetical protein
MADDGVSGRIVSAPQVVGGALCRRYLSLREQPFLNHSPPLSQGRHGLRSVRLRHCQNRVLQGNKSFLTGLTDSLAAAGNSGHRGRISDRQQVGIGRLRGPPARPHQPGYPKHQAEPLQRVQRAPHRPRLASGIVGKGVVRRVALAIGAEALQQRVSNPFLFGLDPTVVSLGAIWDQ